MRQSLLLGRTERRIWDYQFWLGVASTPLVRSDCGILWSIISPKGINWHLRFSEWRYWWREGSIWDNHFWLGEVRCASGPVWFLYNQYLWNESIDIFVWTFLNLFSCIFLSNLPVVNFNMTCSCFIKMTPSIIKVDSEAKPVPCLS